jgi:uncharacterized protein
LVKLVREEEESDALRAYLDGAELVSSELVLTEIPLRPLDRALLAGAGALAEPALRALDAIHVTTAVDLDPIEAFVTYDERQAAAARLAGLRTMAPGA